MTETVRAEAARALAEIETVTATVLAEPAPPPVPLAEAAPPLAEAIRARMAEIDLRDSGSITQFGTKAQVELQAISQEMLADVRAKDLGAAGDSLSALVTTIRGFSEEELDVRRERSLWDKITEVIPGLPPSADLFVAKAIARDPNERYADAREFREALLAVYKDAQAAGPLPAGGPPPEKKEGALARLLRKLRFWKKG